jgi:hypothetical protein
MDIEHIKNLVELMVEHDLNKIELREGETHILLTRGQPPVLKNVPTVVGSPPATPAPANPVTPRRSFAPRWSARFTPARIPSRPRS